MKIDPNAKRILAVAYSSWAFYTLAAVTVAPNAIYMLSGVDTNPIVWGWLQLAVIALGLIGRLIDQVPETAWTRRAIVAGLVLVMVLLAGPSLAMSRLFVEDASPVTSGDPGYEATSGVLVPLVKKWEGKHTCESDERLHCSYLDTIAKPALWTVGYGHTETAAPGQVLTESQAEALLARDLRSYWAEVRKGFTDDTVSQRLTAERDAAYSSLGYNVGVAGVRGSTATRRLNSGDIEGGCTALTWWNKAGGRVVRGLVNRRSEEYDLCMRGVR